MKKIILYVVSSVAICCQGLFGNSIVPQFLMQQIDDPLNSIVSYNLGIAALEQKQYANAERHFSLAVDLSDRQSADIIPAYFSWADTAALELIELLKAQKELKEAALDTALKRAVDAGNRYGNVLVFDSEHVAARERKKIVDRLRTLLEQRKKQQEEEKKQEKPEKPEGEKQDQSSDGQQGDQSEQDKQSQDDTQKSGKDQQKKDKKQQPDKQQPQEEERDAGEKKQKEEEQLGSESEKSAEQQTEEKESVDEKKAEKQAEAAAEQDGAHEQKPVAEPEAGEEKESEQMMAVPQQQQYDANAEMVKKRALVLLDRLQQNEAALQKEQLLKKSAQHIAGSGQYNQW